MLNRPSPRKPEHPILWMIAGPNGCGKSSFYDRTDIEGWDGSVWIVNPDLLTSHLVATEGLALNLANREALVRMMAWLNASIEVHQTVGVETVLSTGKYRNLVLHAQSRGFEVRLIYIVVKSAELQIDRIKARVAEGGHHVDDAKVRTRRLRSFRQLRWFCMHADKTFVFDNSTGEPELIASFLPGASVVERRRVPNDLWNTLKRTVPQATFL